MDRALNKCQFININYDKQRMTLTHLCVIGLCPCLICNCDQVRSNEDSTPKDLFE